MVTSSDVTEHLRLMAESLEKAADSDNTLDQTSYYGSAAICAGLFAVVTQLRVLKTALDAKGP